MFDTHFLTVVMVYYFAKLYLPISKWPAVTAIKLTAKQTFPLLFCYHLKFHKLYLQGLNFRRPNTMNYPELRTSGAIIALALQNRVSNVLLLTDYTLRASDWIISNQIS